MKKRFPKAGKAAPFLAAALLISAFPTAALADDSTGLTFADVKSTDWYYSAAQYVSARQLMVGTDSTSFSPNAQTTRQQVWMILARASGENPGTMEEARTWSMESGLTDGSNPTSAMTREQLAATLYRYADANGYDVSGSEDLSSYSDAGKVSSYAQNALSWAVGTNLINGTSGSTLSPGGTATRAQLATILMRFCEQYGVQGNAPAAPGGSSGGSQTTPPAKPDGDTSGSGQSTPPAKPDGDTSGGSQSAPSAMPGGAGGQGGSGSSSASVTYSGATEITSAAAESGKTYASSTADQSALLISTTDAVTITNPTVTKTGDSDGGDNCNFYGQNAAVLVKGGSSTTITGGTISTGAAGANGVFSYGGNGGSNGASGDGTTVTISNTTITTTGSGSGGIMTTGGGITKASNLTVTTSGQSSAAIRTDRGGGTVTVNGGTYTTNGLGSPAIYCTADITASDASLVSNLSEGVCIEGLNSVTLNDCDLTANNTKCNGNATFCDSVMLYQSMSGDAASGTSTFTMNGGSLTSQNGHVFHVTNTNAVISLSDVTITNKDSDNVLLSVCDDGWSGGSNKAELDASNQVLNGAVLVGDDSTLTMKLTSGSSFTGYISGNIQNASGKTVSTDVGTVSVTLDSTSTWTLTADSYVTSFSGNAANVISNGHTLYVNGVALTGTK